MSLHKTIFTCSLNVLLLASLTLSITNSFCQPCSFVNIPSQNLVGYWPLNGNATDYSGNEFNGIISGATPIEDRFGHSDGAYSFNGINNYIVIPSILNSLDNFTISGWYKSNENQDGSFVYLGVNGGPGCDGVGIGPGDGGTWFGPGNKLVLGGCNGLNWMGTEYELPPIQTWNHFALVKIPGRIQVYINGVSAHFDLQGNPLLTSNTIYFGAAAPGGDYAFNGGLDDVYFYDRGLSAQEIQSLYMSQDGIGANVSYDGPITLSPEGTIVLAASENLTSYQWNQDGFPISNETENSLVVSQTGEYSLTVSVAEGCSFTTPEISVIQSPIEFDCGTPAYLPTDGLVGYWPFCGNANDASENGNHAIVSGAELVADRFGVPNSAYELNGSLDFITVPDALAGFTEVSLSGWYLSPQDQGGTFSYVGMNSGNLGCNGFGTGQGEDVWFSPGNWLHSATGCSGGWRPTQHVLPAAGSWVHFALIKNATQYLVYINGEVVQEFSGGEEPFIANYIFFGAASPRGDYSFGGLLDDMAVYNRVLSSEEVQHLYYSSGTVLKVFNDLNQNCNYESGEIGVGGVTVEIQPINQYFQTDNSGAIYLDALPNGTYTLVLNAGENWYSNCSSSFTIEVSDSTEFIFLPITSTNPCPSPDVSITCPTMRRCSEHPWPIYVYACNDNLGTGVLENAYVQVELDENIIVDPTTTPPFTMVDGLYQFEIGNLNPGQCSTIVINANFSCDLELGETLCMEATLYPVPDCTEIEGPGPGECTEPWDHSSLSVEGDCDENTGLITFTVENGGEAMVCPSEVRVYVDGELFATYYIQLDAESDTTFTFPANGGTWILQADQHPLHPGNSHPNDHVEGCGDVEGEGDGDDDDDDGEDDDDDEWEPGLVDDLPSGDESPFVDQYCGQVVGSFDPNDKQGFPGGVGETHDMLPNEQIQYLIRFQNTGTAPAYTVVIRDTLDADLDIFSVTPGASSHDYSFTMYGERVLQWTFNNIMLPDSFSNEEGSHGFISYTVNQMPGLTDGTQITNSAAIYFDSNEPVITNTTLHTINYCLFKDTHATIDATSCGAYIAPDGQVYDQSGTYTAVLVNAAGCDSTITVYLQSIDLNPQVEGNGSGTLTASPAGLNYQWIDCSTNTVIEGATAATLTGSNGIYAVQVSDGACMEQSECAELVGVGELNTQSIRIYPIPASQQITAMWNGDAAAYTITTPDGRMVLSGRLNPGANAIEVSMLASGNYFLKADNRVTRFVVK
jgi:uncharacterized repeat protein (TIGR01451 family)